MFVAWCRSQRRRCDGKRALPQQLLGFNLSGINRSKWHMLMYMPRQPTVRLRRWTMERKAKIFMNNRSQAVPLPKVSVQDPGSIHQEGGERRSAIASSIRLVPLPC